MFELTNIKHKEREEQRRITFVHFVRPSYFHNTTLATNNSSRNTSCYVIRKFGVIPLLHNSGISSAVLCYFYYDG